MVNGSDPSVREVLRDAIESLEPALDTARLDAEILLSHVLGVARHRLYLRPDEALEPNRVNRYRRLVERRRRGEPVAYLTGRREFWSLDLEVTPATLIPRPETEHLVEAALALVPAGPDWLLADVGTGCGAVALALARERPDCAVVASDVCAEVLAVASRNAKRLGIENVRFRHGDGCEPLGDSPFHVIVSNPPYVRDTDPHLSATGVRFEPRVALAGGADGLDVVRRIAERAPSFLAPGGRLLLEHGFDQGRPVRALLAALGYRDVATRRDYAGHERVTQGRTVATTRLPR